MFLPGVWYAKHDAPSKNDVEEEVERSQALPDRGIIAPVLFELVVDVLLHIILGDSGCGLLGEVEELSGMEKIGIHGLSAHIAKPHLLLHAFKAGIRSHYNR